MKQYLLSIFLALGLIFFGIVAFGQEKPTKLAADLGNFGKVVIEDERVGDPPVSVQSLVILPENPKGKKKTLFTAPFGTYFNALFAVKTGKGTPFLLFQSINQSTPEFSDVVLINPEKPQDENEVWKYPAAKNAQVGIADPDKDGVNEILLDHHYYIDGMPGTFLKKSVYKYKDGKIILHSESGVVADDPKDLTLFAKDQLEKGKYELAATKGKRAVELLTEGGEERARPAYYAAEALILMGKPREAMVLLEKVNPYPDPSSPFQTEAAILLQNLQKTEKEKFLSVISLKMIEQAFNAGEFDKAIVLAKDLSAGKSPLADYGLYYLGESYLKKQMNSEALKTFKNISENFPESRFKDYADGKIQSLSGW